MVGSIMVVGVLTCCALLQLVYDLKALQMNMQCSLIQKFLLNKFEMGHNTANATKNNCYAKGLDWFYGI